MTANARKIAEKLGGMHTLGRSVENLAELRHLVEEGLPLMSLEAVAGYLAANDVEATSIKYRIIPEAIPGQRTRLSLDQGERTERLARLAAIAEEVWEDAVLAREFLMSPQPRLSVERPIDLARTERGAREVEALLMKIEYALPV